MRATNIFMRDGEKGAGNAYLNMTHYKYICACCKGVHSIRIGTEDGEKKKTKGGDTVRAFIRIEVHCISKKREEISTQMHAHHHTHTHTHSLTTIFSAFMLKKYVLFFYFYNSKMTFIIIRRTKIGGDIEFE